MLKQRGKVCNLTFILTYLFQDLVYQSFGKASERDKRGVREPVILSQWVLAVKNYSSQYQDE